MYYKSGTELAVAALSWSFLYILQESLLLTNLLVIIEWISSQTTLTASLESLWAMERLLPSTHLEEEDHFYFISILLTTTKIIHYFEYRPRRSLFTAVSSSSRLLWSSEGSGWSEGWTDPQGDRHHVGSEEVLRRTRIRDGPTGPTHGYSWPPAARNSSPWVSCSIKRECLWTRAIQGSASQDGWKKSSYYCQGTSSRQRRGHYKACRRHVPSCQLVCHSSWRIWDQEE